MCGLGVALSAAAAVAALVSITLGVWLRSLLRSLPAVEKGTVAFFHPFADGGGGGERVLWCGVKAIQEAAPHVRIVIYARAGVDAVGMVEDASRRFNISIPAPVTVVPLDRSDLVLPSTWPRFTLVGQAYGAACLGKEALSKLVPELFIETTGWAFTFPLARLAGSRVACYVHYPTVSADMIRRVASGTATFHNDGAIAGSAVRSAAKVVYYRAFAALYGLVGSCSQATMVNSSWTLGHIRQLWWGHGAGRAVMRAALEALFPQWTLADRSEGGGREDADAGTDGAGGGCGVLVGGAEVAGGGGASAGLLPWPLSWAWGHSERLALVYPPCDTDDLRALPLDRRLKSLYIVSVAQFRPEKDHRLQLRAFAKVKRSAGDDLDGAAIRVARLKLVGGCRGDDDSARLAGLQAYAEELGISGDVDWHVNVSYAELKALLADAVGGLHTMADEHFGICVVEYMAAGVIPIAHDSAGPRMDIVVPLPLDQLADTPDAARSGAGATSSSARGGAARAAAAGRPGGNSRDAGGPDDEAGGGSPRAARARAGSGGSGDGGVGGGGGSGVQITGFLATTVDEYAAAIRKVLVMDQRDRLKIAAAAQRQSARFSAQRFEAAFQAVLAPLLPAAP
ncbi:hypothetical protein FOA52_004303 [Chlamydomonas sp. UWO 241]|nr:hypothetical protein FOA52_004303 [Chlamydomonas sp. UWO 241]